MPAQTTKRFGISVADMYFMVEQGLYCELVPDFYTTTLPNTPPHMLGLMNLRGAIIPVYSLHSLLDVTLGKTSYAFLIGEPLNGAAILIDSKPQALSLIDNTEVQYKTEQPIATTPLAQAFIKDYSLSNHRIDAIDWHVLNHTKLFEYLAMPKNFTP